MLEITNKTKSPIQVLIKSTKGAYLPKQNKCADTTKAFASLNIPGIGAGKNVVYIDDEKSTSHLDMIARQDLVSIRYVKSL